jgi:hypothetical protein
VEGAFSFGRYMNNCKNAVRIERMRQRREAGSVADRFPEVAGIVISMTYNQKGIRSILRTFNFFPSSYAFFRANCSVVKAMILQIHTQTLSTKLPYNTHRQIPRAMAFLTLRGCQKKQRA